uniref:Uncharacterized protein n=1 Tax=Globodera rostochiensis TaxID=31243 RepID=A0A914I073_GLORO
MLQSSTHCARKISRRLSPFVPGSVYGSGCNADELLRKASRKLSQLSELGELHHRGSSTGETESLNGAGSEVSGADSSDCSTTDDLTVLDCSNLNLGALHIVLETGAERKKSAEARAFRDVSNFFFGLPVELLTEHSEDIEHLILDENELDEQALEDIPRLDKLETLSLNGNQIKNIGVLLQYLKRKCPNLKFLSLIGNPGWPHPILNDNLQLYRTYALSAVRLFPSLQFLDTARVSSTTNLVDLHQQGGARKNGTAATSRGRTSSSSLVTVASACRLF